MVLVNTPLGACSASLFDSGSAAKEDAGVKFDARSIDASIVPDADLLAGVCEGDCVMDLVEDFSTTQGTNGLRYRADQRDSRGTDYADLVLSPTAFEGQQGWTSTDQPGPAIVRCADASSSPSCAGLEDYLLLAPGGAAAATQDAVLAFTLPETGSYRLQGQYRTPTGHPNVLGFRALFSRNARFDLTALNVLTPTAVAKPIEVELEGIAGDVFLFTLLSTGAASDAALAINFRLSRVPAADPGACQFATRLETNTPSDECTGAVVTVEDSTGGGSPAPTSEASVPGLGLGLVLERGWFLQTTQAMDYSGDLSISFWGRHNNLASGIGEPSMVSNHASSQLGGILVYMERVPRTIWGCVSFGGDGRCVTLEVGQTSLDLADWHYYRFVRDAQAKEISLCIDGQQTSEGTLALPSEASDLSAPTSVPLQVGNEDGAAPVFEGAIDDVRIFKRALPCHL